MLPISLLAAVRRAPGTARPLGLTIGCPGLTAGAVPAINKNGEAEATSAAAVAVPIMTASAMPTTHHWRTIPLLTSLNAACRKMILCLAPAATRGKRGHVVGQPELDHIARLTGVNGIRTARSVAGRRATCASRLSATLGTVKFRVVPPGEH